MTKAPSSAERLSTLQTLIRLSHLDLMYTDQYLRRAQILLEPLCSEGQYGRLARQRRRLPEVPAELDQAAQAGDWQRVGSLAQAASRAKAEISREAEVLAVADVVYGPRTLHPDAQSLGLTGVVKGSSANLEAARRSLTEGLKQLLEADGEWAFFYRARIAHFEKLQIVADEAEGLVLDPAHLKRRMQEAIRQGHFHEVQRLAEALAADPRRASWRIRVPAPIEERVHQLAQPFSEAALQKAARLGLAFETLAAETAFNGYLSCCCADRARFPNAPLSEGHRGADGCTCGHACPPQIPDALRGNLDLLMVHPFVTSSGTRYLPWFGKETLLVETFSEDGEESNASVLEALGLPRRQGLPRLRIEDALGTRGPALCADLGLDPIDHVVVCIPFDAYLRLAPKHGWGRQPRWTHFDGYQLLRDNHLRALVGGDERYGGANDLCSVERYYDPERLLARFAIVRRDRFSVRESEER